MNELALFAGAGGGILGGKLLGWNTICAVERDAFAASVLAQRQNDEVLEPFPIWSDITTFDGRPWRGRADVVSGGFPCQDISAAGNGGGIEGARSGLWVEMDRIIGEVRPRFCFVENSPMLTSRGLGRVLGDLAKHGYDAEWGVLGAADVGAFHWRDRIWILAYSPGERFDEIPDERGVLPEGGSGFAGRTILPRQGASGRVWPTPDSDLHGMAHGVAHRMDRLRAIGNGQVPECAAEAFVRLIARANNHKIRKEGIRG